MQENTGQAEALRHAAREAGNECLALVAELDQVEHFIAYLPTFGAANAIRGGKEFQVLNHLHVVTHAEKVRHVTDHAANLFRLRVDRGTTDARLAPRRI